jgi:hypothetical protein
LPERIVEIELHQRHELVERLLLGGAAGEPASQIVGAVLKRKSPMKCLDLRNERRIEPASRQVGGKRR